MTKELSTSVYKINWENLIKGALSHSNWGKEFTIYHSGDFKVTLQVDALKISESKVQYLATVFSEGSESSRIFGVPWEEVHFNEAAFTGALFRAICIATDEISTDFLYHSSLARYLSDEEQGIKSIREGLEEEYLDILGLTKDTISPSMLSLVEKYVTQGTPIPYSTFNSYAVSLEYTDCYQIEYLMGVGTTLRVNPTVLGRLGQKFGKSFNKESLLEFATERTKLSVEKFKIGKLAEEMEASRISIIAIKDDLDGSK